MARLASQAKLGFYPTPPFVVNQIKTILNISSNARLLDTCCGEGEALGILTEGAQVETCGVELDRKRFDRAKDKLDHVLWADALYELVCSKNFSSLLFLNPPYDTSDSETDRARIEIQFLKKHWPYLMPRGVLIYVIPWGSLEQAAPILKRCRNLHIFRFPDEFFNAFSQIVVVCTKDRPKPSEVKDNEYMLAGAIEAFTSRDYDRLHTTEDAWKFPYDVPAAISMDSLTFRSRRFDPAQCIEKLKTSVAWSKVCRRIFPPELARGIRPLTSLREGHLAMLLASGIMNGEVVGSDGRRLVVKGSVVKGVNTITEDIKDGVRIIQTDKYDITVRAICFDPVEIITIQQGGN